MVCQSFSTKYVVITIQILSNYRPSLLSKGTNLVFQSKKYRLNKIDGRYSENIVLNFVQTIIFLHKTV